MNPLFLHVIVLHVSQQEELIIWIVSLLYSSSSFWHHLKAVAQELWVPNSTEKQSYAMSVQNESFY